MSAPGIFRGPMEAIVQPGEVRVRRALLSVSDKTGIVEFARGLAALGVELVSTGGTAAALREGGLEVRAIEDFTGFPEIMGGRVKTLHPKLYAGAARAARRRGAHGRGGRARGRVRRSRVREPVPVRGHRAPAAASTEHEVIENIDIGGPTMIRAAAKNFAFTAVVVNPASYDAVLQELTDAGGKLSLGTRESLAAEAFSYTARYDSAISRWFVEKQDDFPPLLLNAFEKVTDLAYGENPHQRAAYYAAGRRAHARALDGPPARRQGAVVQQRAGPQLRAPADAGVRAARRARSSSTTTRAAWPSAARSLEAYHAAFACDPLSAFGGVICVNRAVDAAVRRGAAEAVLRGHHRAARSPTRRSSCSPRKPNMRILEDGERRARQRRRARPQARDGRPARPGPRHGPRGPHGDGGRHRAQADRGRVGRDAVRLEGLQARALQRDRAVQRPRVGRHRRRPDEPRGLRAPRDREGPRRRLRRCSAPRWPRTRSSRSPTARSSRVDAGVTAIIQPGGSMRDHEVVEAADAAGISMVFTHRRHFRH